MTPDAQKSKDSCLPMEKMRFGGPKIHRMVSKDDVKSTILANMTLNVILTLIALITVVEKRDS